MNIETYIREQPEALRRVFAAAPAAVAPYCDRLIQRPPRRLYLVGSGTSLHAVQAAEWPIARGLQRGVRVQGPLEFTLETDHTLGPEDAAIVLSQSGASTTSVRAYEHGIAKGVAMLAVTAEAAGPLAKAAHQPAIVPIGSESVGPKTKGYTGMVAFLLAMGLELAARRGHGQGCAGLQAPLEAYLTGYGRLRPIWEGIGRILAATFGASSLLQVLGNGRHRATAREGAIKIVEMSGVPALPLDTEQALHGWFHGLDARSGALFLAAGAAELELARGAAQTLNALEVRSRILVIGAAEATDAPPGDLSGEIGLPLPLAAVPADFDLLGAIVPLQVMARELALQSGRVPEAMRHPDLSAKLGIKLSATGGRG